MGDFWHMIYQEDTRQIVNLTNSSELSRGKTVEYWPTEFDEPMECNSLSIALIGDDEVHGFMYREFAITNTQ
ncbi:protein-tyrosine phosphatase, partial [Sphaeroforma arctica JP610]